MDASIHRVCMGPCSAIPDDRREVRPYEGNWTLSLGTYPGQQPPGHSHVYDNPTVYQRPPRSGRNARLYQVVKGVFHMAKIVGAIITKAYTESPDNDFRLGDWYEDEMGREYVYCRYQNLGGGDSVAGLMAGKLDTAYNYWDVSCDTTHADCNPEDPAGQCQAVLEDEECGFFQRTGPNRLAATTGGSVTKGDELILTSGARGTVVTKAAHDSSIGTARETDDATPELTAGEMALSIARR